MTTGGLPHDLASAIVDAYGVFERHRFTHVVPCSCHHDIELVDWSRRRLSTTPLRGLGIDDVAFYEREVLSMFGDGEGAKHVAPRVLELVSAAWLLGEDLGVGPELPGNSWLFGDWEVLRLFDPRWAWTEREWASIEACLRRLWTHLLAMSAPAGRASTWDDQGALLAILWLGRDPGSYLEAFTVGTTQARHLAWVLRAVIGGDDGDPFGTSEAAGDEAQRRQVIEAWLRGAEALDSLLRAIADPSSEPFGWELLVALMQQGRPDLVEFDGPYGQWLPGAEAQALAAEHGVDLTGGPFLP